MKPHYHYAGDEGMRGNPCSNDDCPDWLVEANVTVYGDIPCAGCGATNNVVWFTDSELWNAVVRSPRSRWSDNEPILCIPCFVKEAEHSGHRPTGWKLTPEGNRRKEKTMTDALNQVEFSTDGQEPRQYVLPKSGRVVLYPDGICNVEDGSGRTISCTWDVKDVRLLTVEPWQEDR